MKLGDINIIKHELSLGQKVRVYQGISMPLLETKVVASRVTQRLGDENCIVEYQVSGDHSKRYSEVSDGDLGLHYYISRYLVIYTQDRRAPKKGETVDHNPMLDEGYLDNLRAIG